jgi:hypothetical protein
MENSEKIIISPKTKVMQLIETWPQLEEVLIGYVPAFSKLKNPVLRKTVARIATLQQAASVGNVKVEDLVNRLRKEVGQDLLADGGGTAYTIARPRWYDESRLHGGLDVREMLAAGEHPVAQVMADLKQLPAGKIYKLTAPFLPAPLIDKASSVSVEHWVKEVSDDEFVIYFYKPEA